jgi:hypothetical protein
MRRSFFSSRDPFLAAAAALGLAACDRPASSPTALDHRSAHATHGATTALDAHGDLFKSVAWACTG